MTTIGEIFGDRAMTAAEFESALSERGLSMPDCIEERLAEERSRHAAELSGVRAASAIQLELLKNGAYNPTLAAKALSTEGMEGDDDTLSREAGARVAALKKSEPYLFGDTSPYGSTVSTGAPHGGVGIDPDSMSDSEYYSTVARI